jgi:hypothetical protein
VLLTNKKASDRFHYLKFPFLTAAVYLTTPPPPLRKKLHSKRTKIQYLDIAVPSLTLPYNATLNLRSAAFCASLNSGPEKFPENRKETDESQTHIRMA